MSHLSTLTLLLLGTLLLPLTTARHRYEIGKQIADATNIFTVNFMKEVFDKNPENVITSPVSLSTLLAIVHQASAANTRKQLTQVLHAGPQTLRSGYARIILNIKNSNDNATLEFANGAFLKPGLEILPGFERTLKEDFISDINTVDFSNKIRAAEIMNLWISNSTHGLINELFSPDSLSPALRLVLTNAIYFKSLWQTPFDERYTTPQPFYKLDGTIVQVPTMHLSGSLKVGDFDGLKSQWIEIPFQGEQYSMVIVMPIAGLKFNELMEQFTAQHLSSIFNNLQEMYSADVMLTIPKLKLASKLDLIPTLQKLGLTDIFSSVSELPGITGESLGVDQIVQMAKIEVDEKGATAAAATGVGVVPISALMEFNVNRPFLLFIFDKYNSIPMFAGKVTDPSISNSDLINTTPFIFP